MWVPIARRLRLPDSGTPANAAWVDFDDAPFGRHEARRLADSGEGVTALRYDPDHVVLLYQPTRLKKAR